jgi:hypothetical protein
VRPESRNFSTTRALFNIARVRTDLGGSSTAGLTLTDRRNGDTTNTVVSGDTRIVFKKLYYLESQLGYSISHDATFSPTAGTLRSSGAPIWKSEFDRTGRVWGFNYAITGIGEHFESSAGFVPRSGIQMAQGFNRLAWFGSDRSLLQSAMVFGGPSRVWRYGDMFTRAATEGDESAFAFLTFRDGWSTSLDVARRFFAIDPAFAAGFFERHGAAEDFALAPYVPPSEVAGIFSGSLGFNTPVFKTFNLAATVATGATPIFVEGSEGHLVRLTSTAGFRASQSLRAEAQLVYVKISRGFDHSLYSRTLLPRLKLEYQPTRSFFFRVIGEYLAQTVDAPRSATTHLPLLLADGTLAPVSHVRTLRTDWLISFEPNPGTVAFFGYGSAMDRPEERSSGTFRRESDGFFVKLAYQFRH